MRLRGKPSRPKRKTNLQEEIIYDGMTLSEVISNFPGIDPSEVYLDSGWEIYDEGKSYYFKARVPESDAEFQRRVHRYERQLAAYEAWYAANEKEIEIEVAKRKAIKEAKEAKDIAAEKKKIEKKLKKYNKRLDKLCKEF